MTDIQPALTPKQWEQRFIGDAAATDEAVSMGDGFDSVSFSGHQRHALAALCLYGQPFGFTEGDVFVLRMVVQNAWLRVFEEGEVANARLTSLADRIAELLPPSPEHESTPTQVPRRPAAR